MPGGMGGSGSDMGMQGGMPGMTGGMGMPGGMPGMPSPGGQPVFVPSYVPVVTQPVVVSISISIATATTVTEVSGNSALITVTLSQASQSEISVQYATVNGSATANPWSLTANANNDYVSSNGTLTFAAGQTSASITVAINNDGLYEGNETFLINLSNAVGAQIGTGQATVTITDNEIDNTTAMNAVGASSFISGANISDGIYDFTMNKPLVGILFTGWVPGVNNTLTYTFYDSGLGGAAAGVWTTVQQQAASNALQAWGNVTGVNFQYITTASAGAYTNSGADIAMFQTGSALLGGAYGAVNGFPTTNVSYGGVIYGAGITTNEGDLLINQALDFGNSAILPGGNGWNTLVHELGHAIGLSHPGLNYPTAINYGWVGLGPGVITDANSMLYSNMSYNAALWTAGVEVGVTSPGNSVPTGYGGYWQAPDYAGSNAQYPLTTNTGQPTTAMAFDMLAASYVYGANMAYHAGNTTYALTANTTLQTLWDPSGTDTLDASAITEAVILDLTPMAQNLSAAWFNGANINATSNTLLGGAYILPNNVTAGNFLATIIENALGGSGNDLIIGNSSSNILVGYAGNDSLTGGAGADYFTFASLSGTDTVTDFSHNDDQLVFLSSIFNTGGLTTSGAINPGQFTSGTAIQASSNSGQIFLYDTDSGNLFYDADAAGANAAINVATLNTSSALAFDDIQMTFQTGIA